MRNTNMISRQSLDSHYLRSVLDSGSCVLYVGIPKPALRIQWLRNIFIYYYTRGIFLLSLRDSGWQTGDSCLRVVTNFRRGRVASTHLAKKFKHVHDMLINDTKCHYFAQNDTKWHEVALNDTILQKMTPTSLIDGQVKNCHA